MTEQIRQLELSVEEKQALRERYPETNNRRWQERIQCVLLKGQGLRLAAISEVIPYQVNTISEWLRAYADRGIEGICTWQYTGAVSRLNATQQTALKEQVIAQRYGQVSEVVAWVQSAWQIRYSDEGMREILHNLGFSYQKGQIVPGKADGEAQALFFEGGF